MRVRIPSAVGRFNRSSAVKNSFWIISERFLSVGITAIITILSARYLGAEDYGILNYGLTLTTLFMSVMKLGIDSIIVNELISQKSKQGELIGTSIVLRATASLLSIFSMGTLLLIVNNDQPLLITVSLVQSVLLLFQATYVFDYWFQSRLKSKYVSAAKVAATIITSCYSIYLLLSGKDVVWFAASTVLTGLIVAAVLYAFYRKQGGQLLSFSTTAAKYLLGKSYHFIIANIMSIIYVQIDKLMIGNMIGNAQLGLYSAAMTFCIAWVFLPNAILTSIQPSVFTAKKLSEVLYLKRLKQMYFILFWTCIAFCFAMTLTAPWLLPLLLGSQYAASVVTLQIAVWYIPLSILGTARNVWIVAESRGKMVKYLLFTGVIVNVGINLFMIPRFGIVGAAITTIATELFTCFIAPLFFKSTRSHTRLLLEALIYKL